MTVVGARLGRAFAAAVALAAAAPVLLALAGCGSPARAAEGWRAEFDDVCGQTQDAMALGTDELRRLVQRADALLPQLERLPEPDRKVFTKRLKACRDLYAFVLGTRERG